MPSIGTVLCGLTQRYCISGPGGQTGCGLWGYPLPGFGEYLRTIYLLRSLIHSAFLLRIHQDGTPLPTYLSLQGPGRERDNIPRPSRLGRKSEGHQCGGHHLGVLCDKGALLLLFPVPGKWVG